MLQTEDHRDNDNEAQESRQVTSHNTSERNTPTYPNEAYSRDEDSYSSDFESSDSDRDTGRQTDAPPSYHEAAAAPRPLPAVPKEPTAPPMPSDTTAPPSYDEAVSNMTKYTKRK